MRAALWLWVTAQGEWATIDADGAEQHGSGALACLQATYVEPRDVFLADGAQLVTLLASLPAKGRPDTTLIRERDGYTADCAGFAYTHGARYWLGAMSFPDPVADYCRAARWPVPKGEPVDAVRAWRDAHLAQVALTERVTGVKPGHSLSGTAVKAALPRDWRKGADFFGPSVAQADIRSACYGGRIECFQPGWRGEAVEFDLTSAYGWALCQPLPDWQVYQRRAYAGEAEWLDVTVDVTGPVGPMPERKKNDTRSLHWPTDTRLRGWYTAVDLDKLGCRVVKVHSRYAGRMSLDLRPSVERWLELRASSTDYAERATIRALAVGMAGKLWQRPQSWALWHIDEGPAPSGSTRLGQTNWLTYPVKPQNAPLSLPTSASYVTALVRARVWPWIADGRALYTHTDSVHLAYDDVMRGFGPDTGSAPGDWSVKASGEACYKGVNDYRIGKKVVSPYLTRR
jgi:hypothetical protein